MPMQANPLWTGVDTNVATEETNQYTKFLDADKPTAVHGLIGQGNVGYAVPLEGEAPGFMVKGAASTTQTGVTADSATSYELPYNVFRGAKPASAAHSGVTYAVPCEGSDEYIQVASAGDGNYIYAVTADTPASTNEYEKFLDTGTRASAHALIGQGDVVYAVPLEGDAAGVATNDGNNIYAAAAAKPITTIVLDNEQYVV